MEKMYLNTGFNHYFTSLDQIEINNIVDVFNADTLTDTDTENDTDDVVEKDKTLYEDASQGEISTNDFEKEQNETLINNENSDEQTNSVDNTLTDGDQPRTPPLVDEDDQSTRNKIQKTWVTK